MGHDPEGRLLTRFAIPMVISMLVQGLYNMVDSVFVARISESALTAVTLAFPIQMLMVSVFVGTGVGLNSLISRRLGEGRQREAELTATNGLFLFVMSSLLFVLFGLFGVKPFFHIYTRDPAIYEAGVTYLSVCCLACTGSFLAVHSERVMQAQGSTLFVMIIQMTGGLTNLILDPILIFGLLGFPAMGVLGAAVATVLGQWVSAMLGFTVLMSRRNRVRLHLKGFRIHGDIIADIYRVGFPSIIMQSIGTVMNLMMNGILISFTATAVAVFGAYFKIQSVIFMPVFGITGAAMSIMAFNYGARKPERIRRTYRLTCLVTMAIMAAGMLLLQIFPDAVMRLFDASPAMAEMGRRALRIISLHFPIAAFCITTSTLFQALGNGIYSLFISFVRQMIALIPAVWIIARVTGIVGHLWWAFPFAESVALALSLLLYRKVRAEKIDPLRADQPETEGTDGEDDFQG